LAHPFCLPPHYRLVAGRGYQWYDNTGAELAFVVVEAAVWVVVGVLLRFCARSMWSCAQPLRKQATNPTIAYRILIIVARSAASL